MLNSKEIFNLAQKYLNQQGEIYGDELYIDFDFTAKETKQQTSTLDEFYEQIKDCQRCRLSGSRTNLVFGVGNERAKLMCIGEAPGHDEDKQGEPFVGAAGQLLNKILAAIGFKREEVYIANIVKCRPPRNRDPEPEEVSECLPFLMKQIEMIQPELILALGRVAAQSLLGTDESLGTLRNGPHRIKGIPVVVTYHPAALLRNPQWKLATWDDVKELRKIYDDIVGDKPPIQNLKEK